MIDFNSCHISYELVDSYLTSDKGLIIRLSALKDKGFESYKFWDEKNQLFYFIFLELVLNSYQTRTKLIPNSYRTGTKPVPNWYQTSTEPVPNLLLI